MRARKRFGQHFLEPAWADRLVEAIGARSSDRFLEVGPGSGALTMRLAPRVACVTAVEVDRDQVAALRHRLPPNVDLIEADILTVDLTTFFDGTRIRVAGNLPYNISSPILFRLIEASRRVGMLEDATIMVQREVAERLIAKVGTHEYGVLAVSVQRHAEVRRLLTLPPGAFRPVPKVHSAVVRLAFRPPVDQVHDERLFDAMVRSMFTQRRKKLHNALAAFAGGRGVEARALLGAADIDGNRRPESLELGELARLANTFASV